ncbi:hypothetical protein EP18_14035 [Lysinibacillus sphaericus]|nr:hypothetical protein [Lysinibacillus sphaericus]KEK10228.1 hypothetical protein EP18_18815 [Lysinibacillus sphaericus]KEK11090.1 hypothetical protein EP18_14035 [Lysinibacillus sphaericus]
MKIITKLRTAEGWPKLNILFRFLIFILFITTIGQLFIEKEMTPWEVLKTGFSGKYGVGQYIIYGLYVIAKMLVIIVPTIGAALIIRFISYKDSLSVKFYRIASTGGIVTAISCWLGLLIVSYLYKITIEENYLLVAAPTDLVVLFQLYEYALPAMVLTFMDNTLNEIGSAKKIKKKEKLPQDLEDKVAKIFSKGNLTTKEQLHLLRNLEKQTNNYLRTKKHNNIIH